MGVAYTTPDTCSFYYNASGLLTGDFHYSLLQDLPDQGYGEGAYMITAENKHPGLVFEYIFGFVQVYLPLYFLVYVRMLLMVQEVKNVMAKLLHINLLQRRGVMSRVIDYQIVF